MHTPLPQTTGESVTYASIEPGTVIFERSGDQYIRWEVLDCIARGSDFAALLESENGRATVDADELAALVADRRVSSWVPSLYAGCDGDRDGWVPHPRHVDGDTDPEPDIRLAPDTPGDLTVEKVEGRGSRRLVNAFLEGADDGLVFHELGGVASWKAAFVARYNSEIVSVAVLHHYHPSTNGEEIAITRLANHESAPANTSTWLIARVRKWAERSGGYDRIATYAGVGGNDGICYRAAGFEAVGDATEVSGTAWTGDDETTWLKRKFVDDLNPETYADKPSEWGVRTVVDRIVEPDVGVRWQADTETAPYTGWA